MVSKIKTDMFRVQSSIDMKNHQVSNIPEIHGFGSASNKTDIVAPQCNRFFQHQTIINTLSVLRLHLADRPRKFHVVISFSVPLCGEEKWPKKAYNHQHSSVQFKLDRWKVSNCSKIMDSLSVFTSVARWMTRHCFNHQRSCSALYMKRYQNRRLSHRLDIQMQSLLLSSTPFSGTSETKWGNTAAISRKVHQNHRLSQNYAKLYRLLQWVLYTYWPRKCFSVQHSFSVQVANVKTLKLKNRPGRKNK